ncbi:unnamed protein product [Caenorhabditis auriculariae]|uniref:Uncharacterized protein n=1 Tax=Caenorhabditis auriculariae TaxID=2777116 RepID=A0A8S1HWE3_9PELO|nr:unnamed protein product [Caenorhabditis auriculariae]
MNDIRVGALSLMIFFAATTFTDTKDLEAILLPQQHTSVGSDGEYVVEKDVQLGEETSARRACISREEAAATGLLSKETTSFNDTEPFNGTLVEDTMELRIFKPLCDD